MWFYDEMGNFILCALCRKGVRQGCVLGMTILCITVRPVYDALMAILDPEGYLFSYASDIYMSGTSMRVALALDVASDMYSMIALHLGWGPKNTELILSPGFDPDNLPFPRDPTGRNLSDVVTGFKACLGVPKHPTHNDSFIAEALLPVAGRHDNLLDLFSAVFEEAPFAPLRLLQVCGVNRFGHILRAVPPDATATFCAQRDAAIGATLGAIQRIPVDLVQSTHSLPVVAGGTGLHSI
jgi:hypothetical protein